MTTAQETLRRIHECVEGGRYLSAWTQARGLGPLAGWRGARGLVLAGRLAGALGAGRLGLALHLRAGRLYPDDAEALHRHGRALLGSRGPLAALRFARRTTLPAGAGAQARADWLALRATIACVFRDFASAESLLAQAEALSPGRPALAVEQAALLEQQDRFGAALERLTALLQHAPHDPPAVAGAAHLLERLGRADEALSLLERADASLESATLAAHRALLLLERERAEEAEEALARFEALSPLLEQAGRAWLAGRRSDAAYLRGDLGAARGFAEQAGTGFYREVARRLAEPVAGLRRRLLTVPFVQQEHLTCSPASLASVTAYWSRPVDAAVLAREIAFDGTPGHREREWARAHGWTAREFRLTAAACEALIEAGVPFLLGRQGASSAHAQVVAGLDRQRGTILVRDPAWPRYTEVLLERLLQEQAAFGPRCLVLLPQDRAAALAALPLPDEADYDAYHELQLRLLRHDRGGAQAIRDALPGGEAHARLGLLMDVRLHDYDADPVRLLQAYDALLGRHPGTPALLLRRAELLVELGRGSEAQALLEPLALRRGGDPALALRLAELRAADDRRAGETILLAERVLRARPGEPAALALLARRLWARGEREEALELQRLAACSDAHGELHVPAYVRAARQLGRSEQALEFLRARTARLGDRASAPARSLSSCLEELGRLGEASAVLDEAVARHPEDGELLLFVAEAAARHGRLGRARELLEASRGRAREVDRLRVQARLCRWSGDAAGSLEAWRAVASAEPLALDALRAVADLLSALEGPAAALACLEQAAARAPTSTALWHLLLEWLREDPPSCEAALDSLLARHPEDVWAHRERALLMSRAGRHDEALAALTPALELAASDPGTLVVHGHVLLAAGRRSEAGACLRAALEAGIDSVSAIDALVDAADGDDAKREALRFVATQLQLQPSANACFAFQRRARGVLPAGETLALLEAARRARPEAWPAWSAEADERIDQGQLEQAGRLLREATERFPHAATLWLDSARLQRLAGDQQGELAALRSAVAAAPASVPPLRRLARTEARAGQLEQALELLRRASALDPADRETLSLTAELQQRAGDRDGALATLRRTLFQEPRDERAWQRLDELEGDSAGFARALARERPGDPDALLAAAWHLPAEATAERLALLDRVLSLRPRAIHAHDQRAVALLEAGRLEEALAACAPAVFGEEPPRELLGRRAWILHRCGRVREAIEALRDVLVQHPHYWWGARQLSEWVAEHGSAADGLEAAERLLQIAPGNAEAHRRRAEARLRCGDEAGAHTDLEQARALEVRELDAAEDDTL